VLQSTRYGQVPDIPGACGPPGRRHRWWQCRCTQSPGTAGETKLIKARYSKNYLTGAVLAIAATNNNALNKQIYRDCQELEILCNVVDTPELCDFFVPAVVKRGSLQIAIGTEGHSPAYAGHIRKKLEEMFTDKHGEFVAELEALRNKVLEQVPDPTDRKAIFGRLVNDESFDYFVKNGPDAWCDRANAIISEVNR